jgi:hypothetical protein
VLHVLANCSGCAVTLMMELGLPMLVHGLRGRTLDLNNTPSNMFPYPYPIVSQVIATDAMELSAPDYIVASRFTVISTSVH